VSDNGKVDLNLNEYADERLTVAVGDYRFSVPVDMRTSLVARLLHCFTILGKGSDPNQDLSPEHADIADAELWVLLEEIMQQADPPPPKPVRELFGNAACFAFLSTLSSKWSGAQTNSTTSLPLPTSTTEPSTSATYSEAEPSTLAASE
jgi:hypothetical protein